MRLAAASTGDVVRNAGNGSHYRFDRVEKSKARIRPLELFPTGRLVPKPTDTLVSTEIQVLLIGRWTDGMRVEGNPTRSLLAYEQELVEQEARLIQLEAEYLTLPQSGTGKLSRGSFANKVKNCRGRIETLRTGLGIGDDAAVMRAMVADIQTTPTFVKGDVVQVPSGRPGLVMSASRTNGTAMVQLQAGIRAPVPMVCLRPWSEARLATI